jgi:hypothetical protein
MNNAELAEHVADAHGLTKTKPASMSIVCLGRS